jgi:vacuolar-type H+-ATPase subunit H
MDIDYLVDQLEDLRDRGVHLPLTKMVLIDEEQFLRLINQLRISVPKEVQEAKQIQQERDRVIAEAQERAQNIVALSEQQAEELVGEHGIARRAEERERRLLERAREEAESIRAEADQYALQVLHELEEQLASFHGIVQNGIQLLQQGQSVEELSAEEEPKQGRGDAPSASKEASAS